MFVGLNLCCFVNFLTYSPSLSFSSCDRRRRGGRLVCRLPGDAAGVQDEEEGRRQLYTRGTQTGHGHLPETRQAGGVLCITLVRQRDTPHTEGERKSEREKREKYSKPPSSSSSSSSSLPPHLLASPHPSLLLSPKHLGAPFSLRTWNFLFNENEKEDKKRKKKIQIYSEKITHTHEMFLK